MMVSYQAVHTPLLAPAECVGMNTHIRDRTRRVYAGMVSCMDQGVGNITRALTQAGMLDNTVIIFTTGQCLIVIGLLVLPWLGKQHS